MTVAQVAQVAEFGEWKKPMPLDARMFAEAHGVVPSGVRAWGFRTDDRPYQRLPLEVFSRPEVRKIRLVWVSQVGKTTVVLMMLQSHVCSRPTNSLIVFPGEKALKDYKEDKLGRAILRSPRWRKELAGQPDVALTFSKIRWRNSSTYLALAKSEQDLSQRDCELIVFEEEDKFPSKTQKEGSPQDQARARQRTFRHTRREVGSGTPTTFDGPLWREFKSSNRCEWEVPCLGCGARKEWALGDLHWGERPVVDGVKMALEAHAEAVKEGRVRVWWQCPACGHEVDDDRVRMEMNRGGDWKARAPEIREFWGFHLNAFASPDVTMREIAAEFLKAKAAEERRHEEPMMIFRNHFLALPYQPRKMVMAERAVVDRCNPGLARGTVPTGTEAALLGCDVQDDGVFWIKLGVNRHGPRVAVSDWGFLQGDFEGMHGALDALVTTGLTLPEGRELPLLRVGFDSGSGLHRDRVYAYARKWALQRKAGRKVLPTKGERVIGGGGLVAWSKTSQSDHRVELLRLGTVALKDLFAGWFARSPGDPNAVVFASEAAEDLRFQRGIVSEERQRVRQRNGQEQVYWQPRDGYEGENHWWDALIIALGVGVSAGLVQGPVRARRGVRTLGRIKV